jgi:hypothetical protein
LLLAPEGSTTVEGAELALALPSELLAVTTARTVAPRSEAVRVYVVAVAPAMLLQSVPEALQSCHR